MPSPGEDVQVWSPSATLNNSIDPSINWAEGQPRASVNNSARSTLAAIAKWRDLLNGSIIAGGSVNGLTFFSGLNYTTTPTGLVVRLRIGPALTNTGPCTLNMDNLGQVQIIGNNGLFLTGGELVADSYQDFLWNGTNWILLATLTAPTAAPGDADSSIANTAFVAAAIAATNIRVFLNSGTYPTTTATCKVLVYCKGGGGGGASSNDQLRNGGGGGEGAESWKLLTASALSAQAVTVAAGGSASVFAGVGNDGATSSIGTLVTAPGGFGGTPGHMGGAGGNGGAGGTKDFGMPGAPGHVGASYLDGTLGWASPGGGKGGSYSAGVPNSGGGGSGVNGAGGSGGNNGGSGIIVCFEYGVI